jgi:hypothetical protein
MTARRSVCRHALCAPQVEPSPHLPVDNPSDIDAERPRYVRSWRSRPAWLTNVISEAHGASRGTYTSSTCSGRAAQERHGHAEEKRVLSH